MKFGKQLKRHRAAEWEEYYLDYQQLKKALNFIEVPIKRAASPDLT